MFPGEAYHNFRADGTPIFSKFLEYKYSKRDAKKIIEYNSHYNKAVAAYRKKFPKKDLDKLSKRQLMEEALRLVAFWEEVNQESENFAPASWGEVREIIEEFYEDDQLILLKNAIQRKRKKIRENFHKDIKKAFNWVKAKLR